MLGRIQPILAKASGNHRDSHSCNRREQPTQPDQHVVPLPIAANNYLDKGSNPSHGDEPAAQAVRRLLSMPCIISKCALAASNVSFFFGEQLLLGKKRIEAFVSSSFCA